MFADAPEQLMTEKNERAEKKVALGIEMSSKIIKQHHENCLNMQHHAFSDLVSPHFEP